MGKNFKDIASQSTSKKNNINQNNNKQNIKIIDPRYSNNNNNILNNENNKNKKESSHIQGTEEIGLHTPGNNKHKIPNNNSNQIKTNNNNSRQFICRICKSPLNNTNFILCQNCFKKEIINETYSSYLQSLNQEDPPEALIDAKIAIINLRNEKRICHLDDALNIYNNNFKNEKLERKNIILELKKRICIACLNEIKSNSFIELPCKCRMCSFKHLIEYFAYYNNLLNGFKCRCKDIYTKQMMMDLSNSRGLSENIQNRIKYYFQKKLDSCCCICAKSDNIIGKSNTIVSLEQSYYNKFIRSLIHYFCQNCIKYQNTEFFCQVCGMKHFWNSN